MAIIKCTLDHRMIEVVPGLLLCECSSYGPKANLRGMVADARALVAKRYGSVTKLREKIEDAERKQADERQMARAAALKNAPAKRPVRDAV